MGLAASRGWRECPTVKMTLLCPRHPLPDIALGPTKRKCNVQPKMSLMHPDDALPKAQGSGLAVCQEGLWAGDPV